MTGKTYNGWTNYETWRINLEMIDGIDPRDIMTDSMDESDFADYLKELVEEEIEQNAKYFARDYALAFIVPVNWHEIARAKLEAYDLLPKPFHVVGIDEEDGSSTILEQFDNSGEAREWMTRYASKENAGNWKRIEVLDTREECSETVASWESAA